jgi:methyl-accepting chemotaxis protein
LKRLQKGQPLIVHADLKSAHRGLITLPEGVLMTVAGPVTNSDVTKPYNGTLLFGRWFDADQKDSLSKTTHMTLDFSPTETNMDGILVEPKTPDLISGTTVIKNLDGNPALKVRVDLDRAVARQGRQTLKGVMVALVVFGVVMFLVLSFMVNRIIVARVVSLSSQLFAKNMSFDFSQPTVVPGRGDEIAELTESVNGLIAAAQQVLGSISETGK